MGDLRWTASYVESLQGLSIEIEQFKNNQWIKTGRGSDYCFIPAPGWSPEKRIKRDSARVKFHKGINRYRLKMTVPVTVISAEIELISNASNDDGSLWIVGNRILLDRKAYYEVLDRQGTTIIKGENETIDISALPRGSYFFYTKKATKPFTR